MATAIQCAECGFTYGFTDEEIEYIGFLCPGCKTTAPKVEVDVDLEAMDASTAGAQWAVVDRLGQPVAGPFASPAAATVWTATNRFWDHPRGPLAIAQTTTGVSAPRPAGHVATAVERERVPAFIDALDVQLVLWIAESMIGAPDGAEGVHEQ